jgi:hypothetical protein
MHLNNIVVGKSKEECGGFIDRGDVPVVTDSKVCLGMYGTVIERFGPSTTFFSFENEVALNAKKPHRPEGQ